MSRRLLTRAGRDSWLTRARVCCRTGLLALEGELTPILVQMVKSADTNGLLDNDSDSRNLLNM